jgi:hypothetical protein
MKTHITHIVRKVDLHLYLKTYTWHGHNILIIVVL